MREVLMRRISFADYRERFGIDDEVGVEPPDSKLARALHHASDVRKFEIQLYWQRATYFWTIIASALAAYGVVQTVEEPVRTDLSVFISCIGLVISFAWYCVNRGSKQWQENWENHVDMLENPVTGPLYKTVIRRPPPKDRKESWDRRLTGPGLYSVSKINQIISIYICVVWLLLIWHALPDFTWDRRPSIPYIVWIGFSLIGCVVLRRKGRTEGMSYEHEAFSRDSMIVDP
jgi:hypothetical protein